MKKQIADAEHPLDRPDISVFDLGLGFQNDDSSTPTDAVLTACPTSPTECLTALTACAACPTSPTECTTALTVCPTVESVAVTDEEELAIDGVISDSTTRRALSLAARLPEPRPMHPSIQSSSLLFGLCSRRRRLWFATTRLGSKNKSESDDESAIRGRVNDAQEQPP